MTRKFSLIGVVGVVIGILFLFPTREYLKSHQFNFGLSYNDHVLIGTLGFIVAIVAAYKLLGGNKK